MYSPLCIQSYSKLVFVQKNPFESRITTNVGPKQTKQRPAPAKSSKSEQNKENREKERCYVPVTTPLVEPSASWNNLGSSPNFIYWQVGNLNNLG